MIRFVKMIKRKLGSVLSIVKLRMRGYSDYFNIPFYYKKSLPRGAENVLKECCEALEKVNINYYVTDGTALGFYRENRFIPHDDDLDVDIVANECYDAKTLIEIFTKDLGMHIGRKVTYKGKMQQLVCYNDSEIVFDMMIYYKDGTNYLCHLPECEKPCKLNEKFFGDPFYYNIFDKYYPLHSHVEEWLVARYGSDWKIPKTEKGDWREDATFF